MKKFLTNKINNLPASATLAMAAKARELKNSGIDIIGLSLGELDFNVPDLLKMLLLVQSTRTTIRIHQLMDMQI